jgi:hypothetical protein
MAVVPGSDCPCPTLRRDRNAKPCLTCPLLVCLDCNSVNQTFAHHRKRVLGSLPMSKDKTNTRLPLAVVEHEARTDGGLTVRDALHVAKPMFHAVSPLAGAIWPAAHNVVEGHRRASGLRAHSMTSLARAQPSDGRMTQYNTPLLRPSCRGAQTWAPPSGATTLLIVSRGTRTHSPSTLTS